jgi:hypothetical protein
MFLRKTRLKLILMFGAALAAAALAFVSAGRAGVTPRQRAATAASAGYVYYWVRGCKYVLYTDGHYYKVVCRVQMSNGIWDYSYIRQTWLSETTHVYWAQNRSGTWFYWNGASWVRPRQDPVSSTSSYLAQQRLHTYSCNQMNMLGAMAGGGMTNPFSPHC